MPALAESRNRVLRVLLDPDSREEELVTAIESDVALVVAVMRLANADEGRRNRIATVPEAVRALAPEGVETLARRIGVYGFFERIPGWQVPPGALPSARGCGCRDRRHDRPRDRPSAPGRAARGRAAPRPREGRDGGRVPRLRRAHVGPDAVAERAGAGRAARVRRRPRGHRRRPASALAAPAGDRARGRAPPRAGCRRRGRDPEPGRRADAIRAGGDRSPRGARVGGCPRSASTSPRSSR